jgi:hypothetical protein
LIMTSRPSNVKTLRYLEVVVSWYHQTRKERPHDASRRSDGP